MTVMAPDESELHEAPVWQPGEWTTHDLEHLPDDGRRYELFDGKLVVSPAPGHPHQRALRALSRLLDRQCPPALEVYYAPFDVQPTRKKSDQPDLLVTERANFDLHPDREPVLRKAPLLVVEVLSTGSRKMDLEIKPAAYATAGVDLYWTFDPRTQHFVARRRRGREYVEIAAASGKERITLDEPFPVEICPAEIIHG